jgi:hypothetical protein
MKKILVSASLLLVLGLVAAIPQSANAQVPGAIISAGALGGVQSSSMDGISSGTYMAVRGSFSNFFGEYRIAQWGGSDKYVHETGFLAGSDFSLWHFMLSGAVGVGASTYQAAAVAGVMPTPVDYTSFLYEAQAMYQFNIVSGMVTAGVGVNYLGESSSQAPINGWGIVGSINIGL